MRQTNRAKVADGTIVLLREDETSRQSYFVMKGCVRSCHLIDVGERTTEF